MRRLLILLALPFLLGTTYYVRTDGHDTGCTGLVYAAYPGSGSSQPCAFLTVQKGVTTAAAPGDNLKIGPGTYFGTVTAANSGTSGNPIVIESFTGDANSVVLDSGVNFARTPNNNDWTLIDGATGEWESNFTLSGAQNHVYGYVLGVRDYENERVLLIPYADTRNSSGKVCVGGTIPWKKCSTSSDCSGGGSCTTFFGHQGWKFLRATTTTLGDPNIPFYVGPGAWMAKTCVGGPNNGAICDTKSGSVGGVSNANIDCPSGVCTRTGKVRIRLAKTPELRDYEARWNPIFPSENQDPRAYAIALSNATNTVRITATPGWQTWRNITFNQATRTIHFDGPNGTTQEGFVFEGIIGWTGDNVIRSANAAGDPIVSNVTVTQSQIRGDWPWWIFWSDQKNVPFPADKLRSTAISMKRGAHDWTVSYTNIQGGHDGIGMDNCEYNLVAHHNRIVNMSDDGFELEGANDASCPGGGGVGAIDIYQNYIAQALTSYAVGQSTETMLGTGIADFDHNVVVQLRDHPVNRMVNLNSFNGGHRYGFEYSYKNHAFVRQPTPPAVRMRYCYNTVVLATSGSRGIDVVPHTAWGLLTADVDTRNNIFVKVNGVVQGTLTVPADQHLDGNLYYRMNMADGATLIDGYNTVAAICAAEGLECHGVGSNSGWGTAPEFATFNPTFDKTTPSRWQALPGSQNYTPQHFQLAAESPARGAAISPGDCETRGLSATDLGAIPYGTADEWTGVFPFNQGWGGPYFGVRGAVVKGGRAVGARIQ